MILIHELGHYWAARFFDVKVEAFSFGFGPRLFGFRRGETDFRFSAILFGGYVKMAGEQPGDESASDPRGFLAKPRWQRLIVVFAGPAMNVVLAVALLTGLYMVNYPKVPNADGPAIVAHVVPNSPAAKAGVLEGDRIISIDDQKDPKWEDVVIKEISSARRELPLVLDRNGQTVVTHLTPSLDEKNGLGYAGWFGQAEIQVDRLMPDMDAARAGLKPGDVLLSANGQPIHTIHKLHEVIRAGGGKPVEILYSRNGERNKVMVTPKYSKEDDRWMIGVQLAPRVIMTKLPFPEAIRESVRSNMKSGTLIYQFLVGIIERRMSPKSLEGPIRIAQISGEAAREGPTAFIGLMSMVSLNLAIFNLLPIPILDGGVILLLLVEMLMRRDLSMTVKEAVFKVGFVFLMAVVVFVIYNDISKILPG
jgi:regulator of sigma E protease